VLQHQTKKSLIKN